MGGYINRTGSKYYFRRPVPKDLIGFFKTDAGGVRREWKYSLGVTNREEAKPLLSPYVAETDLLIADARAAYQQSATPSLSSSDLTLREQEELDADAGFVAEKKARHEARREVRTLLRQRLRLSTAELGDELASARDLMNERGEDLDGLQREIALLKNEILELGGQPGRARHTSTKPAIVMELFEGYAAQSRARPASINGFRSHVRAFVRHSGQQDAVRIELKHIVEWVDSLRQKPGKRGGTLSEKTIRTSYLAALSLTLSYGVTKLLLPRNVMSDLRLMAYKKPKLLRDRHFNEEERVKLLEAARNPAPDRSSEHVSDAKRWVPWLCAYTGARVGEMLQLRKSDVRQEDGIWAIHLTPLAGDVKNNQQRWVPLHEHLVAEGFLSWVQARENDRLFYMEPASSSLERKSPPYQSVYNRLREWIREHVPDPEVQPCHAWRHTFKSLAREYDMDSEIVDVIQGHRPATVGKAYGGTSMKVRLRELEKLPRFPVAD